MCPYCGSTVGSESALATEASPPQAPASPVTGRRSPDSSAADSTVHGQFLPGTQLTERYRIVGLLGRGGMGEVYRADDLELGQSVALKFLPKEMAADADRLARFRNEVRIARQIAHANVCRVYDIGSADSHHFLSMEFVDGEDLASALRRMGRPAKEKALEIARQLCAGLEAAHQNGVLHRDLKPANVMVDDRGRVRITDFGLAGFAVELEAHEIRSGTPQYMAPEQLAGKEVSKRSDIYALGLILFELFSGRKYRDEVGKTATAIGSRPDETSVSLSSVMEDVDPVIERVVSRCLAEDPTQRPPSALTVAAALPGGDPLAAALAAGETPSPELVAQAGQSGALPTWKAWTLLASTLVVMIVSVVLSDMVQRTQLAMPEKTPQALAEIAATAVRDAGYEDSTRHEAYGFQDEEAYKLYLDSQNRRLPSAAEALPGEPGAVSFWYRGSPQRLVPDRYGPIDEVRAAGDVTLTEPPMNVVEMVLVRLDPRGRLLEFRAVPPATRPAETDASEPDFSPLLEAAGATDLQLTEVEPTRVPPVFADQVLAWEPVEPSDGETRFEAASLWGRPVSFRVTAAWNSTEGSATPTSGQDQAAQAPAWVVWWAALIASVVFGLHNLRLGRADRRGAHRLAVGVFALKMIAWFFHSGQLALTGSAFVEALGNSLQSAVRYWFYYVAIEPYFRRIWPHSLIGWSRLWLGRLRDPMVGRHLLIGALAGASLNLVAGVSSLIADRLGSPPALGFASYWVTNLLSPRMALSNLAMSPVVAIFLALQLSAFFLILLVLLRKRFLAIGALGLVITGLFALDGNHPIYWPGSAVIAAILILVLVRSGILSLTVAILFAILVSGPVTLDFDSWYAGSSVMMLTGLAALTGYGFYTSLGGQALFKDALLESEG